MRAITKNHKFGCQLERKYTEQSKVKTFRKINSRHLYLAEEHGPIESATGLSNLKRSPQLKVSQYPQLV